MNKRGDQVSGTALPNTHTNVALDFSAAASKLLISS